MIIRPLLFCIAALLSTAGAQAATAVSVHEAWIRSAPPGAMMLAGYAILRNDGDQVVRINRASSADFELVEIHRTIEEGGVSRMRQVPVLEIAPGAEQTLQPGGVHLMLMRPRRALKDGESVVIDLLTAEGDIVPGVFQVRRGDN